MTSDGQTECLNDIWSRFSPREEERKVYEDPAYGFLVTTRHLYQNGKEVRGSGYRSIYSWSCAAILFDNKKRTLGLVDRLVKMGHCKVAVLYSDVNLPGYTQRRPVDADKLESFGECDYVEGSNHVEYGWYYITGLLPGSEASALKECLNNAFKKVRDHVGEKVRTHFANEKKTRERYQADEAERETARLKSLKGL